MPTLHLGVADVPYAYDEKRKVGKGKKRKLQATTSLTTGDVAELLEEKYHLFELYYETHVDDIVQALEDSYAGAIESILQGAPLSADPAAAAGADIGEGFKQFILTQEVERIGIPGTPTKAALRGVNHRLAHPYAGDNARRPSFRDTGLFVTHAVAWVD